MNVVEARGLRKEYGNLVAVSDVSLTIEKGQVVGLIGPNGAGKTTLLKMLSTLLRPTAGEVHVMGKLTRDEPEAVRKLLGYMPDFFNLYQGLTLDACVRFFGRSYGVPEKELDERVTAALGYVGLLEKRHEVISHLSRGMTQRLGVANLLVHDPALIVLDEPASGLDPVARIQLRKVLARLAADGKTILISSHILTELEELCSHVIVMHRGQVRAQGSIDSIRQELAGSAVTVSFAWPAASGENSDNSAALEEAVRVARQQESVENVRVEGQAVVVNMPSDPRTHAQLNRALVMAQLPVCGLKEERQGLEALFMQIAGGASHGEPERLADNSTSLDAPPLATESSSSRQEPSA